MMAKISDERREWCGKAEGLREVSRLLPVRNILRKAQYDSFR